MKHKVIFFLAFIDIDIPQAFPSEQKSIPLADLIDIDRRPHPNNSKKLAYIGFTSSKLSLMTWREGSSFLCRINFGNRIITYEDPVGAYFTYMQKKFHTSQRQE